VPRCVENGTKRALTACIELSIALCGFFPYQNFALTGVVGLADDAFLFHALHQRGRAVVADLQPALDIARRGFAVADDDLHRLLVEVATIRLAHPRRVQEGSAGFVPILELPDSIKVLRGALRFEMADDFFDLLIRAKWSMYAADAAAARHVEHVALAEQLLGPLLSQYGAAVDLRGDLER